MSFNKNFAENLRREVSRFRTISDVCAGVGINRQQFNKYLAGNAIPNAITLRKICGYLGVPEQTLFAQHSAPQEQNAKAVPKVTNLKALEALNRTLDRYDFNPKALQPGIYHCYFPAANLPDILVRSIVTIKSVGGVMTFKRVTKFRRPGDFRTISIKGHHSGSVISNGEEFYLLGSNRLPPHQLSIMTVSAFPNLGNQIYAGFTITHSSALVSTPVCLVKADPQESLKSVMAKIGIVYQDDLSVDPLIRLSLKR